MKLSLLVLAAAALFSAVLVAATVAVPPTCTLTALTLTDANTGVALNIHDSNGNPFTPGKFRYYCNCGSSIDSVTVQVLSDDADGVTYQMSFEDATRTVTSKQYLAKGGLSTKVGFTLTPDGYPSYANTIVVAPSSLTCSNQYTVTCVKKPPTPSVNGDPQFVGLRGQNFQVHGVSGEVYSIISDPAMQMNSRFVFLNKGDCPVINGKKQANCFAHAGSYLGEIGIKTSGGDRVQIVSGPAASGFKSILVNGVAQKAGQVSDLAGGNVVAFNNSHLVTVQAGNFHLEFDNSDMFINQRVRVLDWSSLASHGLLGQTWRAKTYPSSAVKHIEGKVDDYVVAGKDLFGDKFLYNQFGSGASDSTAVTTLVEPVVAPAVELNQDAAAAPRAVEALAVPTKTVQNKLRKNRGIHARKVAN